MGRPATGSVVEKATASGVSYALRITHEGRRHFLHLGTSADGMTRTQALDELAKARARIKLGEGPLPTESSVTRRGHAPWFRDFAKTWLERRVAEGLARKTIERDEWSINHLGPFFHRYRVDEIDVTAVDAYRDVKMRERNAIAQRRAEAAKNGERCRERPLSNGSINATLRTLTTMLEDAVEYGYLPSNPASGKRRRLKATTPARPWVEPEQLPSLFAASAGTRRLLLELLALAGLRIGEALALRWSSVDLGTGVSTSWTPRRQRA